MNGVISCFQLYTSMVTAIPYGQMAPHSTRCMCFCTKFRREQYLSSGSFNARKTISYDEYSNWDNLELVRFCSAYRSVPGHKGRWIGIGTFLMGLGSFICALPHFMITPYRVNGAGLNESDYGQCTLRDEKALECVKGDTEPASYLNPYFLMFLLGQTLHGIGATPLFSIGTVYLDENVSQKASPVYLGNNLMHCFICSVD
ncbi:unnamed protein product [Anisakis simplex]|uniref:Solute carrier organic anion transporter family member 5A1 n=1 Tax=Anisakis simplex TaxID=6269 RepID=A0A0M3J6J3_ANISI|nr:unnamed protein product [Anisakis simplex]